MHEASIPADATHLKRGTDAPNDEDGRDLRLSAADRSATEFYAASHDRPLRCEAQRDEAPDCYQELARQGDDRDAADSTLKRANTVPEPCREAALWLVAKPKPGQLDERFAGSAVAGAIDAPIAIHAAALKRRWGKTQLAGRPRKTLSAWEYGGIWATERIRNCLDLRLIGEKAGDFVRKVEKSLSSTPGL
jgi:hypothetical protein